MISKEQLATLTEVLATASVVGVGWALGGTVGAAIMAGIGINLTSAVIQTGSKHLKDRWLSSHDGILNHDIQLALARAFVKSLDSLEQKYFESPEANAQPSEKKEAIRGLFRELKNESPGVFAVSVGNAVSVPEIKEYLYGDTHSAKDKLWERVEGTKLIYTYYGEHFKNFLRDNLNDTLVSWFGEELKTDNRECNKAWRAFQRMLLEGIQADVKAVRAGQQTIHQDLQALTGIRTRLDELKGAIDKRTANEPFQAGLEEAVSSLKLMLESVTATTQRIESKVEFVAAGQERTEAKIDTVVAALGPKAEQEPKVPDDIQALLDEAWDFRNNGKYEDAKVVLQKAMDLGAGCGDALAIAAARYYSAIILHEWDKNSFRAKSLLRECLQDFQTVNSQKHVAMALYQVGIIELDQGHLDQAEAYFSQSLELDQKNNYRRGVGVTLHMLGWLEDRRGHFTKALDFYDQALTYWLGVYEEGDPKTVKEAAQSIAGGYHHKGLVYEHLGRVEDVQTNYLRALEWHRRSDFKPDVGKILYLLARLKYRESQYDEGAQFLDEAIEIYRNIGDNRLYALCLDLKARGLFTLGQRHKAIPVFELALAAVEKTEDHREQVTYLDKLGQIYLKDQELDKAKDYFERAEAVALRYGLLEGYADAVKGLAQISHFGKNPNERNRLLENGINTLEKLLASLEGEPRRAFTVGQIGFFYESMENFQQALIHYQRAEKLFGSLSDIGGVANCLGSIARIKGLLGKKDEEFETYRKLKQLVDGTPYYDLIAGAAINIGEINMQIGNLDEAKRMFQEADFLCRKYHLEYIPHLEKSMMRLTAEIKARNPPELNFEELIEELFDLVEWFPEAKHNLLCLWMYGRDNDLYVNYRNTTGVKLMICQDNVDVFLSISEALHSYHELCLLVVNDDYETGMNIVPFPMDKKMFFGNRYQPTSDVGTSESTGNKGVVLVGWTRGLPPQANELILSRSVTDLIREKIFFLPYERHLANDKLFSDTRFCKELGLIPIYFDALPSSESVAALHSAKISLPAFSKHDAYSQRKQIRKVKRALIELLSVNKTSAPGSLNALASEAEELSDATPNIQRIQLQVNILQFPSGLGTDLHLAVVIKDSIFSRIDHPPKNDSLIAPPT